MPKIGKTEVGVGDYVRTDAEDWEGRVAEIDGDTLTVHMNVGLISITGGEIVRSSNDRKLDVSEVHFNRYDPRFEESGKTGPFASDDQQPSMPAGD